MKQKNCREESKDRTVGRFCGDTWRKVAARITRAKAAVLTEWSDALETQRHALRLALNEAEAMAWQTTYPDFVFPALALEKVQAVAAWNRRQRTIWWKTQL